jgi:DNA-binding phage protein
MTAPRAPSFDDYLVKTMTDPVEVAAYIEAVMEQDDPATLLMALPHVAKAHGMAEGVRHGLRLSVVPEHV